MLRATRLDRCLSQCQDCGMMLETVDDTWKRWWYLNSSDIMLNLWRISRTHCSAPRTCGRIFFYTYNLCVHQCFRNTQLFFFVFLLHAIDLISQARYTISQFQCCRFKQVFNYMCLNGFRSIGSMNNCFHVLEKNYTILTLVNSHL